MAGIIITALLALSMWAAIAVLVRRRRGAGDVPGHLTVAQRRHLYRRLGLDPDQLTRQRRYNTKIIQFPPETLRRRSTDA